MSGTLYAGTSGFSYPSWRGGFYPAGTSQQDFLKTYAERLPSVELIATYRRLPPKEQVRRWAEQTPDGFLFAPKLNGQISHGGKLGLMPAFSALVINSVSGTNAFAQAGAVAALTGPQDEADAMRAEFIARRSLIVEGFNAIPGVSCVMPHGAFYAFPNMSSFGRSSNEIADHLLYDAGVCGLSGTAFGSYGEGYLRFSYANSREKISTALERVGESLAKLERTGELVGASA